MFRSLLWGDILTPTMMLSAAILINHDTLAQYSPYAIMLLSGIVLYGLIKLYRIYKDILVLSLFEIPIFYFLLYAWIAFFTPSMEYARLGARLVVIVSMSIAIHVVYSYLRRLRKGR
jgi:hypothetical protein